MSDGEICVPICNENTKRAEMTRPPCNHYDRRCTLVSPCKFRNILKDTSKRISHKTASSHRLWSKFWLQNLS
jgi:hypothetical protein